MQNLHQKFMGIKIHVKGQKLGATSWFLIDIQRCAMSANNDNATPINKTHFTDQFTKLKVFFMRHTSLTTDQSSTRQKFLFYFIWWNNINCSSSRNIVDIFIYWFLELSDNTFQFPNQSVLASRHQFNLKNKFGVKFNMLRLPIPQHHLIFTYPS